MLSSMSAFNVVLLSTGGRRPVSPGGDVVRTRRHPGVSDRLVSQFAGSGRRLSTVSLTQHTGVLVWFIIVPESTPQNMKVFSVILNHIIYLFTYLFGLYVV